MKKKPSTCALCTGLDNLHQTKGQESPGQRALREIRDALPAPPPADVIARLRERMRAIRMRFA
jgi:hypothetical protein